MQPQAISHVFENGFGKRIGFLKHHAYPFPEFDHIHISTIDVVTANSNGPLNAHVVNEIIHAVQAAEQSGFAAAAGPDESGDHFLLQLEGNVFQRLGGAIKQRNLPDINQRHVCRQPAGGGLRCQSFSHNMKKIDPSAQRPQLLTHPRPDDDRDQVQRKGEHQQDEHRRI